MARYLRKYEQLSSKEISDIQKDITKGAASFQQLAAKYVTFDTVIKKIASEMGMNGLDDKEEDATPIIENNPKGDVKRKRNFLDKEKKQSMKEDIKSGKYTRDDIMTLYEVSASVYYRMTKEIAAETLTDISEKVSNTSNKSSEPTTSAASVKVEKDTTTDVVINDVAREELIPLSNFVAIKCFTTRLDSTIKNGGITTTIFNDLSKLKSDYDFDKVVKDFFEKYIVKNNVNILKIYMKSTMHDQIVASFLMKNAMLNKCNLTYILPGGIEQKVLDTFCESNNNLQRISAGVTETARLLYKTSFEDIREKQILYTLHMNYQSASVKQIIVCDEYSKILEVFMRLQNQYKDMQYKAIAYKLSDGNQNTIFTCTTGGFIDVK